MDAAAQHDAAQQVEAITMADGKPGRRAKGTISGRIMDQRSELSELLVAWNPLGLTLPAAELPDAYDELTNSVLGLLIRAGDTARLEALLASWLRRRAGRTTPATQDVPAKAETIMRWWLA